MHSLVALLVLAIGCGATLYYWKNLDAGVQADTKATFTRQTESIVQAMHARLRVYDNFMSGSAGLFTIQSNMTQTDWEQYYRPYNIEKNYPSIEGIGVSRYLPSAELPAYLANRAEQGDTDFTVFPAGNRAVYVPVTFEARFTGNNGKSRGYDAYTDENHRVAMERSVQTNATTMSGMVSLISESRQDRSSFLLYLPVYKKDQPIDSLEQRRAALTGFIHTAIDNKTFFDIILPSSQNPHIAMQIYDAEGANAGKLAYQSGTFQQIRNAHGATVESLPLNMYGHTWRMVVAASPELLSARERQLPTQALWRGLVTCIFFSGLVWYLITDRERKYARQKREEVQTAKDDLLSLASHQLRTPATVVKQYVGMLLQGYAGSLSDQQLSMLSSAYDSNERQLEIINQLLYVARLDAGRITLHPKTTDMTKLLRDVVHDQKETINARKQRVTCKVPKRPVMAEIDPHYMRMVLENLLSNAVKYTPEKGSVTLELKRAAGDILIRVRDTGVGIDAALQANVFEKFTRVENELSNDINGSGVGLYLTKQIVELHGGTITVHSSAGQGSLFTVRVAAQAPLSNQEGDTRAG